MPFAFTAPACFFAAIIIFGIFGLLLGFLRAILVFAFVLAGWFFLVVLNGGPGLTDFVCVKAPVILGDVLGRPMSKFCSSSSLTVTITTVVAFALICLIGLLVTVRLHPGPNLAERVWGVIPGAAMGYAAVFAFNSFISHNSNTNSPFTFSIQPTSPTSYIPVIVVIIVVALAVGVIAWRWVAKKK